MVNTQKSFNNMENTDINSLSNEELERIANGDLSAYEQQQEQPQQQIEENDDRDFNSKMSNEELEQYLNGNGVETNQPQMQNEQPDPNPKQSFLKAFAQALNNASRQGDQFAAVNSPASKNTLSGVASGGYENVRGLTDLLGLNLKPREFGGNPESFAFNLGKAGGQYIPQITGGLAAAKGIAKAAPFLGKKLIPEAIAVGSVGAAANPGSINERLVKGAEEAALVPAFHGAVKGYRAAKQGISNARSNLNYARPEKFQTQTSETLHDIFQGKPVTSARENKLVYGQINKKGRSNKAQSDEMYNEAIKEAMESGYNGVEKAIEFNTKDFIKPKKLSIKEKKKLSLEELFKDFKKNKKQKLSFKNPDDVIKYKNTKDAIHKEYEIKKRFYAFHKRPSLKNAHDLQVMLNERSFKLKHPLNDIVSKDLGKIYGELREKLVRSIESTLEKNGDINALKSYQNATKNYAENVVPYIKTRAIRDIVNSNPKKGKYTFPEDPINFLTKNKSSTQKIVSDLPEKSKRFLLQKMIEGAKSGEHINPVELKKLISDIKATRKVNLVRQKDLTKLEDLLKQGKRLEKTREFVNKNKGKLVVGGVLSVPGFIGGKKVLKELFSDNKD